MFLEVNCLGKVYKTGDVLFKALDYVTSIEILKLLEEVNRKFKTTILIITHNNAIAGFAQRVIRLRSGEIVENLMNDNIIPAEGIEW